MKISSSEAYSLLSETDINYMDARIKEFEKVIEDCTNVDKQFYLDGKELFLEIFEADRVLYRLMFKAANDTADKSKERDVIQLPNNDVSFKCLGPEGVLEVAKTLEGALETKSPYIFTINKGSKSELTGISTREEYLQFYVEWAMETLYELIDFE